MSETIADRPSDASANRTDELWRRGAGELAGMIRRGDVTSREVIEAHLERIGQVNDHLNAIVRVLADTARAGADAADAAVRAGGALGPLHGVPFTVKENIDLAGTATTQGVKAMADAVSPLDAPTVERMRAAGAIPIGRTNLPDFGLRVHTDSDLHGRTLNPWNSGRTAGGSSGGEAASLASGMSPIGLGNDLGGSLRNPAHCCGIASIKPSSGVVPHATVIPPTDDPLSLQVMAVQGVMARRVADVRTGLLAVAGPHRRDPQALPITLTDDGGRRLTVAVAAEPPGGSTHPGVAAAIRAAADALTAAGHRVVDACPPGYAEAIQLWSTVLMGDVRAMRPLLDMVMGEGGRRFLDGAEQAVPQASPEAVFTGWIARSEMARNWHEWFQDHDVLLTPTWTQPAFEPDADLAGPDGAQATFELMRPVLPANLLGLPAAVVSCGLADGLPVGAHVTGPRFADLRCLAVAEDIETALALALPIDPR